MTKFKKIRSRIGYHVVYDENIVDAIDYASKNGFASIQVDLTMPKFFPERYRRTSRQQIRAHAKKRNIEITLHLPGEDFSLQTLHPKIRSAIVERIKEVIRSNTPTFTKKRWRAPCANFQGMPREKHVPRTIG